MQQQVSAIRVLVKAMVLFIVFNLLFAVINPPVGKITGYNSLWPGRLRFPFAESPEYYAVSYNAPVIEDFDAMFGAHVLESASKPAGEFRVFLVGDSGTWGGHVSAQDALSEQINRLGLTSCDGRPIKVYNLGYPWPSLLRDTLVLDWAKKRYDPDLVIWLITLHGFEKQPADREFLVPHMEQLYSFVDDYNLRLPPAYSNIPKSTFWDKTIVGQRRHLKDVLLVQAFGPLWAATGYDNSYATSADHPPVSQAVDPDITYFEYKSPKQAPLLLKSLMYDPVRVGHEIAGSTPMVMVNEPIFIASGRNSDVRYNYLYPRWAYDAYHTAIADWMTKHDYLYYDFWDAVPASEFANDMFHRDPLGEARFAGLLSPIIQESSCP
jgi:hypothetical protein